MAGVCGHTGPATFARNDPAWNTASLAAPNCAFRAWDSAAAISAV
jgi:hypothetical protein